ncbi:3-keto-5-aminohexanoate cleavage protein [Ferrovibrio sp.]|uniref:3-keto-5-aminohexanoate cleavage protein n=1 Tax=Ferrovibrio sp. TaxID=1917215 RepID=UPI003D2891D0
MRPTQNKVIITCAVTGNQTKPEHTPHLPITPEQIADACLGAAEAGAAIVHIHVRHPDNGRPSMELAHYRETVERIRAKNTQLILNLTTGPGGRFVPSEDDPKVAAPGTTLCHPLKRVEHIEVLRPDICTLDLNTMNSGKEVVINTPGNVRKMADVMTRAGVKPEIELFDSGDIALMQDMLADGSLSGPILCSFVLGIKYGFQPSPETILYARGLLPRDAQFTAFGVGRHAFPMAAQSYLAGGHVRVGLEDAIMLDRTTLAPSNAAMVTKARLIIENMGGQIATPEEAREIVGLPTRLSGSSLRAAG